MLEGPKSHNVHVSKICQWEIRVTFKNNFRIFQLLPVGYSVLFHKYLLGEGATVLSPAGYTLSFAINF